MAVDLKPCPFCSWDGTKSDRAHDQLHLREVDQTSHWIVRCPNCGASGPVNEEQLAGDSWNTRPIEDDLRAEIKSLRDELAEHRASVRCKEETVELGEARGVHLP